MTNKILSVEFAGFYESIHQAKIESYFNIKDDESDQYLEYYNNCDSVELEYSKQFLSFIKKQFKNEFLLDIDFELKRIEKGEFDKFKIEISQEDFETLDKVAKMQLIKDDSFMKYLQNIITSRNGYVAHYTFEALISDVKLFTTSFLEYFIDKFENFEQLENFEFI